MEVSYEGLIEVVQRQEETIKQLEEEVKELCTGKKTTKDIEEEEKLKVANEKLKYRLNILKTAYEKEVSIQGSEIVIDYLNQLKF